LKAERHPANPLITPKDVPPSRPDFEVICVFNAAATKYKDETILLLRVAERAKGDEKTVRVPVLKFVTDGPSQIDVIEIDRQNPAFDFHDPRAIYAPDQILLTSISHLQVARSRDGVNFTLDPKPAIFPDRHSEMFGIEDPRITYIDGRYHITYKSVSPTGICTSLAVTDDFLHFEKKGIIFCPENLDVCIFPEKINDRYVALHRPVTHFLGGLNMWMAYSNDMLGWGDHSFLMGIQPDTWESGRIGGGAVPIRTEHGWLEIYHGATPDDRYCLGAVLFDLDDPRKIVARAMEPILEPTADYERQGFVSNVVFTCGAVEDGDTLRIYYGAADTFMARADVSISELTASMLA